jgi:hypothetical protein
MALTIPESTPQKRYHNNDNVSGYGVLTSGIRRQAFGKAPGIRDKSLRQRVARYSHLSRKTKKPLKRGFFVYLSDAD